MSMKIDVNNIIRCGHSHVLYMMKARELVDVWGCSFLSFFVCLFVLSLSTLLEIQ